MKENTVAIAKSEDINYSAHPPFHPPQPYPEYPWNPQELDKTNQVYELVRQLFFLLDMDKTNYGKNTWNPLGELIKPGDKVVIKPNFVLHFNDSGQDVNAVITHGSVIRVVMDYVYIALRGRGEIVVADAPQMNADFDKICELTGIGNVIDYYRQNLRNTNVVVSLFDLRQGRTIYRLGIVWKRIRLNDDASSYVCVDLGNASEVVGMDHTKVYGADYNRRETIQAHSEGRHKYTISKTILDADVVISLPKMKVHRKAGVTLNLKNMVGINGNKNHILHYRIGSPEKGGDEFFRPNFMKRIDRRARDFLLGRFWQWGKYPYILWSRALSLYLRICPNLDLFEKGDWYGNDTIWRSALDLNKILLYADKNGMLQRTKQRKYFSVIDGIIAGEGEGPLAPTPKPCGILLAGMNPVIVDVVCTRLMGFDINKIPILRNAFRLTEFPLINGTMDDVTVRSTVEEWNRILKADVQCFVFEPTKGWKGHIEI